MITDEAERAEVDRFIAREFDELDRIAGALGVLREVSPRWLDAIAAVGEIVSSRLVAAALTSHGLPAAWIDARRAIVTGPEHTAAPPLFEETRIALEAEVDPALVARRIPVHRRFRRRHLVTGVTTTLGRGGSDYSAAIIGASLGASEIQIWTDVDGMLTADPRVIADVQVVPHLSFAEASELAYFGAKVLHPATIQPAVAENIPVKILNSRRPLDARGTLITHERPASDRAAHGGRLEDRRDGRRHHLDPHADGARLPQADLRCVRAMPDAGRRRDDLGGERLGHDRRPPRACPRSSRGWRTSPKSRRRTRWPSCAPSAKDCRRIRRSSASCCRRSDGVPVHMVSQAASRRNITFVIRDGPNLPLGLVARA